LQHIQKLPGVDRILFSSSKASIVKSDEEIEGIIAKGISKTQLKTYLGEFAIKTVVPEDEHWVAISKTLAKRLNVGLNDNLRLVFFVQDSTGNTRPRARKLTITTLFETGVDKVDANMVLLDESIVARMMPDNYSITQLEIWVKPGKNVAEVKRSIQKIIDIKSVRVNSAEEFNRQIFDWLSILDLNVIILLCLITVVAITATCTTLLILMTERTAFIGLMQSMGARYADIQKIFIYQASIIAVAGILIGNFIAIGICMLQNHFKWLTLNQEVYFIKYVAMKINLLEVLTVDVFSIGLIYLSLYIPARYIKKIHPIIALKFK
jgi:lipoprotein-releasing system permease protein